MSEEPVLARMQSLIGEWEGRRDRRLIFLSCYAMMTHNMLAAIEAEQFEDNPWVAGLLRRFAEYYFEALQAYEASPGSSPSVWQMTFETCQQPKAHVLQNLILGVNAHINYDLVFALVDMLKPEWDELDESQRQMRYRDHCRVNEILAGTIDAVQDQVVERFNREMDLLDRFLGPLDEWLVGRLISAWREQVWEDAVRLLGCQAEAERANLLHEVEARSLSRARAVLGRR